MRHTHLKRLSSTEYRLTSGSLQIYRQVLFEPFETHWHDFYELAFVLAGQGEHVLNGVTRPLQRGSLFLLTPADFHMINPQAEDPLIVFDVIFQTDILKEEVYRLLFQDLTSYQLCFAPAEADELEREFERLFSESQTCKVGSHLILPGTLERILIELYRKNLTLAPAQQRKVATEQHQKLSMSLIYMHHHFREPLSLEDAARQVHLSPSYFSECFHRTYGISFQRYLQELRLHFARSLLSAAQLPVSHTCFAAGFQTLSHFERTFKQYFGLSPRQFLQERRR